MESESQKTTYFDDYHNVFETRTYYPPQTKELFMSDIDRNCDWTYDNEPRKFWHRDFMKNPFVKSSFYYAEFNHPTMGKAIYGASRNRGYVWRFGSEKDLKASLSWSLGEKYKKMLEDGYIVIKKGHVKYSAD